MIVVIGAGIAGLSLAYELTRRGSPVTVLEAATIASGASGVATSYLEPRPGKTAMRAIERESMMRWPDYAAHLEDRSGVSTGFRSEGQIKVSLAADLKKFEKDLSSRQHQGEAFTRLDAKERHHLAPDLSSDIVAAAHLPNVRWVTGRNVCQALAILIRNAGGEIRENTKVEQLEPVGHKTLITTDRGGKIEAEKLALCTGMGANVIDGLPTDIPLSRAVRGVNLVVDQSGLQQPLNHLIKHHRGNMCPRENNQLIVGTTYEAGVTSLQPDADIIEFLYQNAEPILPLIRELPLITVTAGLRSKIGDGNLRLGRSDEAANIYYSLSHGGAGYLRAPVIADELAGFVLGNPPGPLTHHHTHCQSRSGLART